MQMSLKSFVSRAKGAKAYYVRFQLLLFWPCMNFNLWPPVKLSVGQALYQCARDLGLISLLYQFMELVNDR